MPTSRNWPISQLPGLSAADQDQLAAAEIHTTFDLLRAGRSRQHRQTLATQLHLHNQHVNRWVALADLSRVPSVGCQYCGLLLHAGISSVTSLSQTPIHQLQAQVRRFHVATFRRNDLCPGIEQISAWIQEARALATPASRV